MKLVGQVTPINKVEVVQHEKVNPLMDDAKDMTESLKWLAERL